MKILYVTRHFNHSGYIILEELIRQEFDIGAVLLHKDKSKWRHPVWRIFLILGYRIKCLFYRCKPLRTIRSEEFLAKRHDIPIIREESIKSDSFYESLKRLDPDIIVLGGGWHELIPKRVFSYARLGCINTHPSLLPEFRGTSITRWQVYHGVDHSGSTIHYVDDTFDTGGILAQKAIKVQHNLTPQELFLELGKVGADIMVPLLKDFEKNGKKETYFVEHNPEYYGYFKRWQWSEEALSINWDWPLKKIHFHVLGNTQESYEYLGPIMEHKGRKYFLRETDIKPLDPETENYISQLQDQNIHVYKITDDGVVQLVRKNSLHVLFLVSLQKFDSRYKYRRSHKANRLLQLKKDEVFKKSAL